jgi:transposase-like protein
MTGEHPRIVQGDDRGNRPGERLKRSEIERNRLRRENERLKEERDILKNALGFVASESK